MNEPTRPVTLQDSTEHQKTGIFERLKRLLSSESNENESVRDVIEELIEERIEEHPDDDATIDLNERLLLSNVLKLRDVTAVDIMVPRADIAAVEVKTSLTDVLTQLVEEGHSRLPVYRETLDDVVGFVHIKDLAILAVNNLPSARTEKIESMEHKRLSANLIDMVRTVLFVSPAVRVMDLLLEMRLKRTHMALVVDEYGGIDGLLTIEDVVEQIVGEIEDEHDDDDGPEMMQRDDGTVLANARVMLEDFEREHGTFFTDEERGEADTLGGLVARLAGRVPGRGELVRHPSGLELEVLEGDPRSVRRIRIRGLPEPTTSD
ncbi:MAG: magnesium/cobalt efflux protein [Candidatus Marinimicrobia bacterium]|nr:magnesium/cobalt efflux protein [Candidatus Neomarinimicrobiota bacterium]